MLQVGLLEGANSEVVLSLEQAIAAHREVLGVDRLIHEPMRLCIVHALSLNPMLTFNGLKAWLATTDGNLGAHARKLEDAGYISCIKYFEGRLPRTEYRLTPEGRRALDRYLDQMATLIRVARAACRSISSSSIPG